MASRDDVIFSGENLLQGRKNPLTLILTEPVPVVFEFVPLIGQNFFLWSISEEVHPGDSAAFYTKCSSTLEVNFYEGQANSATQTFELLTAWSINCKEL